MVRIRLRRVGSRHQPAYRMVAADEESPRDGRFLENLGHYNPRTVPATIAIDEARVFDWLGRGAQPSDSARRVLISIGCWGRWERLKAGESLEVLMAETKAKASATPADAAASGEKPAAARPSKKARARAASETAPAGEG